MWYAIVVMIVMLVGLAFRSRIQQRRKRISSVRLDLDQELSMVELPVKGKFPQWLAGDLIRNGPVMFSIGGKPVGHWFDGLGMLHAFAFEKGRVYYSNRFLRSDAYRRVVEKGSIDYLTFAADPCRSLFQQLFTIFRPSMGEHIKNANVNIAKLADQWAALTEIPLPVRFDKETLETLGVLDYSDDLPGRGCFASAHPHYDAVRGETISYLVKYGSRSTYIIYKMLDGSSKRIPIASIPVDEPSYMHSFAVTDNYVILTEFPLLVKPIDFLIKGKPFIKNFHWKPEQNTTFLIVDRSSGELASKCTCDAFFAFHHANAYEKNGELVIDLVAYPDPSIIYSVSSYPSFDSDFAAAKEFNAHHRPFLQRFHLSLATGAIQSSILYNGPIEFPRINELYDGRAYQYLYGVDPSGLFSLEDKRELIKIDLNSCQPLTWSQKSCHPGEPVFVPSANPSSEDDGVVLSVVFDLASNHSFIIALDAKSFQEIARAELPHKIPAGLHGQFFK